MWFTRSPSDNVLADRSQQSVSHARVVKAGSSDMERLGPNPPEVALLLMSLRPGRNITCSHLFSYSCWFQPLCWASTPYAIGFNAEPSFPEPRYRCETLRSLCPDLVALSDVNRDAALPAVPLLPVAL